MYAGSTMNSQRNPFMSKIVQFPQQVTNPSAAVSPNIYQHAAHLQFNHEDVFDATRTDQELYNLAIAFSYQDYDTEMTDTEHRLVAQEVVRLYKPTE